MTPQSQAIVELVDRFPAEIREEMLKFLRDCAQAYLKRGIGLPGTKSNVVGRVLQLVKSQPV